jgi:chemotaxis regulatin CheY-phosphate phosphatase CheZ
MNELYEIAIESTEVELLLTEGFADKTKQLILKAVKKIKEMIKKMISYIKTKLIYKIKRNRKDIADIIKQNAIIRSNATVVVPTIFNQFDTLLDALIKAIYDKLEMMLRDKDFDLNDIDFTSEIDAIKDQLASVIEMPVKQAIHIIDTINKYSDNNLEDLQKIFNRSNELLTSYSNIAEKTDYDDRCIAAMQKIIPAINAIIMFINHLSDISKSVMVKITNNN